MSPDMLTLVAAVLAYDLALESCDPRSVWLLLLSLKVRSETRVEKDIVAVNFADKVEKWCIICESRIEGYKNGSFSLLSKCIDNFHLVKQS